MPRNPGRWVNNWPSSETLGTRWRMPKSNPVRGINYGVVDATSPTILMTRRKGAREEKKESPRTRRVASRRE